MGDAERLSVGSALRRMRAVWRRVRHSRRRLPVRATTVPDGRPRSVLVVGVYLADRPNSAAHVARRLGQARRWQVSQRWAAVNGSSSDPLLRSLTTHHVDGFVPKFALVNRLLAGCDWRAFDYLLVVDDDIVLPIGFLDAFLGLQAELDLALAQPARTRTSFFDWQFVLATPGILGRCTRFVEIGPLFSVRNDLAAALVPFDENSPMGWGYDFVWPVLAERLGLRMGIVDATPVDHSLRGQATSYDFAASVRTMHAYLARNEHLGRDEAFTVLETY